MKMYEIEMGDYSLRLLKTKAESLDMETLDIYYYNRNIFLHVYGCTSITETEYNAHQEYYDQMPVDIF